MEVAGVLPEGILDRPLGSHDFDHTLDIDQDEGLEDQEGHQGEVVPFGDQEGVGDTHRILLVEEGIRCQVVVVRIGHEEHTLAADHTVRVEHNLVELLAEVRSPQVVRDVVGSLNLLVVVDQAVNSRDNGGILDNHRVELSLEGSPVVVEADKVNLIVVGGRGRESCLRCEGQADLDVVVVVGHP